MPLQQIYIETTAGRVCVTDGGGTGQPVLFIHGNGFSSSSFSHQFNGDFLADHRLLAIDLPGHGKSDNARDPETTYTLPGFAKIVRQVISTLKFEDVILVGWSLGGHIALEIIADAAAPVAAIAICGSPPISHDPAMFGEAFKPTGIMGLLAIDSWTDQDACTFVETVTGYVGRAVPDVFVSDAIRAHGQMRPIFTGSLMSGNYANEATLVGKSLIPLALIDGADDPLVERAYQDNLTYANRWNDQTTIIENAGHLPFWQQPQAFDTALASFINSVG